jgi:hypothetical protein
MNQAKKDSIRIFFETVQNLKDEKIIRSSKYSGDIGEYICQELYGLNLSVNQREVGYDALDSNNTKYQIKVNNSVQKTNQDIGNISSYDRLLLLVTNESRMFDKRYENAFMLIYNIPVHELSGNYIAKSALRFIRPDKFLDRELNIIDLH